MAEGDEVVEVFGESKDGAGFSLDKLRGDGLFDATIVKCAAGSDERDAVSHATLACPDE